MKLAPNCPALLCAKEKAKVTVLDTPAVNSEATLHPGRPFSAALAAWSSAITAPKGREAGRSRALGRGVPGFLPQESSSVPLG